METILGTATRRFALLMSSLVLTNLRLTTTWSTKDLLGVQYTTKIISKNNSHTFSLFSILGLEVNIPPPGDIAGTETLPTITVPLSSVTVKYINPSLREVGPWFNRVKIKPTVLFGALYILSSS